MTQTAARRTAAAPSTALAKAAETSLAIDADIPEGMVPLGTLPYEDYWHLEEDQVIYGELLSVVKRYELDQETKKQSLRKSFVVRVEKPCMCGRSVKAPKPGEPEQEIRGTVIDTVSPSGVKGQKDVYEVEPGTLVAFDWRGPLSPFIPLAIGKEAYRIYCKVLPKQTNQKGTRAYWTFKRGAERLLVKSPDGKTSASKPRDTSLDYLNMQAEFMKDAGEAADADLPF